MEYEAYTKAFDKKKESEVYFQTAFHGSFNDFSRFSAEYIEKDTENKLEAFCIASLSIYSCVCLIMMLHQLFIFINNNELTSPADNQFIGG